MQDLPRRDKTFVLSTGGGGAASSPSSSLTSILECIIHQHLYYCAEADFNIPSSSTLLRILDVCSTKYRWGCQFHICKISWKLSSVVLNTFESAPCDKFCSAALYLNCGINFRRKFLQGVNYFVMEGTKSFEELKAICERWVPFRCHFSLDYFRHCYVHEVFL